MIGLDEARGKNRESAAKYGHIYIQVEKTHYIPGEIITGNIYLNLYQHVSSNQIFLKLKGKESVHIYEKEYLLANSTIINAEKSAYSGPLFEPGQYVFPFTFLLPTNIPDTFFQQGESFLANIVYYLEASIRPSKFNEPRIKYKHRFVVEQLGSEGENNSKGDKYEVQTPMKSCCFSKGSNTLKIAAEKASYFPGEIAQVNIELDNSQSGIDCFSIKVTLKQRLTLRTKGKVLEKYFTKVERELEGVPARQKRENQFTAINLLPLQEGSYWEIKEEGNIREHLAHIEDVSKSMNSTVQGQIITSEYFIEVNCQMDGRWTAHPSLTIPLEIRYPPYRDLNQTWPPDWNPRIMNNVNFGMSVYNAPVKSSVGEVPSRSRSSEFQIKDSLKANLKNLSSHDSSMPLSSEGSGIALSDSRD